MKKLLVLISVFFNLLGYAQSKPETVIPFTIEKNVIYIYCKVNQSDSLKFLFDTGADGSVINIQSRNKPDIKVNGKCINRGANGSNEVEQSEGNTIRFGNIERTGVSLTLIDFGTDSFDGIIGTDLMMGNIFEIDYNTNEIRFFKQDDPSVNYTRYDKMKLHMVDNYPTVESTLIIEGKEYKGLFGLDSGADDLLTIAAPFAKNKKLEDKMRNIGSATAIGSDGSESVRPVVLCPLINFSGKYLYNIPISLSNSKEGIDSTEKMVGFFGNNFLKRFNVIFDFKNKLIYFKLNKNLYFDMYE